MWQVDNSEPTITDAISGPLCPQSSRAILSQVKGGGSEGGALQGHRVKEFILIKQSRVSGTSLAIGLVFVAVIKHLTKRTDQKEKDFF